VNDVLVAVNNVEALLHHIHTLISVVAYSEDTSKHLQEPGVGAREGGGTTMVGGVRRNHI
jgi:hypothetical protein